MSVNIERNVGQISAASGWYQNGRAVSAQEKEKDAPQPKADNAVKKGQRTGSAYGIADELENSVRAYANLMMRLCRTARTAQGSVMWRMKIQRRVSAK